MKKLILMLLVTNASFAYDYKIKDEFGRTTGYVDEKDGKVQVYDNYGRKGNTVESDGTIKDTYGRKIGTVEKK